MSILAQNSFLLIPGNPPAVHFYELWGNEIKEVIPDATVRVSPYPRVPAGLHSVAAMNTVAEAHRNSLIRLYEETGKPVTVIGHSLGGYFAMKLLEKEPHLIHEIVLLHPFLKKPALPGRAVLTAAKYVAGSTMVQQTALKIRKLLHPFSAELAAITDDELLKSAQLALHEGQIIARDESPLHIADELRKKIRVFYCRNDWWCADEVVKALGESVRITECHEPHQFVTSGAHRKTLFQKITS